jgi:hypothetical protein
VGQPVEPKPAESETSGTGGLFVIKQYGERRTGTNYLRSVLDANFSHVLVLMHVLGDKHSPPVAWRIPPAESPEGPYEWVRAITLQAPAKNTDKRDAAQIAYLRSIAPEILTAVRAGRFAYLISAKDPYAWGASIAAFRCFIPRGLPRGKPQFRFIPAAGQPLVHKVNDVVSCFQLKQACLRFNHCHFAWLRLHEASGGRSTIVRYEDLLADPGAILGQIERKHGLCRRDKAATSFQAAVGCADWDHAPAPTSKEKFDPGRYIEGQYMDSLTPAMRSTITETIDWQLMSKFGYQRR